MITIVATLQCNAMTYLGSHTSLNGNLCTECMVSYYLLGYAIVLLFT